MKEFEKERVYIEFFVDDNKDLGFKIHDFLEIDNDHSRMIRILARGIVELTLSNPEILFEAGKEAIEKDMQELLTKAIKEKQEENKSV